MTDFVNLCCVILLLFLGFLFLGFLQVLAAQAGQNRFIFFMAIINNYVSNIMLPLKFAGFYVLCRVLDENEFLLDN